MRLWGQTRILFTGDPHNTQHSELPILSITELNGRRQLGFVLF